MICATGRNRGYAPPVKNWISKKTNTRGERKTRKRRELQNKRRVEHKEKKKVEARGRTQQDSSGGAAEGERGTPRKAHIWSGTPSFQEGEEKNAIFQVGHFGEKRKNGKSRSRLGRAPPPTLGRWGIKRKKGEVAKPAPKSEEESTKESQRSVRRAGEKVNPPKNSQTNTQIKTRRGGKPINHQPKTASVHAMSQKPLGDQ